MVHKKEVRKNDIVKTPEDNLNQKQVPISIQQGLNIGKEIGKGYQSVDFGHSKNTSKVTNTNSNQKRKPENKKQWLWEFSKKIVVLVAIAFFIVLLYTLVFLIINPDSTAIQFLLDNVSDIFKVTVVSYAIKAGFENVIKIHKDDGEV